MANSLSFVLLACFISACLGHGWLSQPPSRQPATTNSNAPCDTKGAGSPAPLPVTAGNSLTITWITPHNGDVVTLSYTTAANENVAGSWTAITSFPYSAGTGQLTIPSTLASGAYVLQWYQDTPGPYYNCVDLQVTAAPPTGSNLVPGSNSTYAIPNGVYNAATGNVTCNAGYSPSKDTSGNWSCIGGGLSAGAGVGIFLLVLFIVCVAGFIGIAIYLKKKRPEKYDEYKGKLGDKVSSIKGRFSEY